MQKVTNLGHFVCNRLPSAQSVPLCAVRAEQGRSRLRCPGWLLVVRGRGPPGDPPGYDSGWPERCLLVVCLVGELHIHSEVLAGVVAWFQRFPGPGDVLRQDECATVPALHTHPAPGARADRRIRVIPPFTDRGL